MYKSAKYSKPVIVKHENDLSKDWYVYFTIKFDGKLYKYKRREGVNRIKSLDERIKAIEKLLKEIKFDLKHG